MLYINSERVDFKNNDPDYKFSAEVKDYKKTIDAFRERHGQVLLYETPKPKIDPQTGNRRPYKGYSWPSKAIVSGTTGEDVWVYSKVSAPKKDGIIEHTENIQVTRGSLYIDLDSDPDFAYFITKHRSTQRGILKLYDPKALNREIAEKRVEAAKFHNLIYDPRSVLFENTAKLRMIAKKWGLSNVDSKENDEVRNNIYDVVMNGEDAKKKDHTTRGVKEFMEDFNLEEDVKVGADIQTAIDRKALYLDGVNGEWMLVVSKDQMPMSIMKVPDIAPSKAKDALIDYLKINPYDLETINKVLKGSVTIKHGQVVDKDPNEVDVNRILQTPEEVDDCDNWTTLQKNAVHHGFYKVGLGKVDVKKMLKEKMLKEMV
jgi:hypothetical protein